MKRFVLVLVASILVVFAAVSCDKLKPRTPPIPLPRPETEPASPAPQVTAPKAQAPAVSEVR